MFFIRQINQKLQHADREAARKSKDPIVDRAMNSHATLAAGAWRSKSELSGYETWRFWRSANTAARNNADNVTKPTLQIKSENPWSLTEMSGKCLKSRFSASTRLPPGGLVEHCFSWACFVSDCVLNEDCRLKFPLSFTLFCRRTSPKIQVY